MSVSHPKMPIRTARACDAEAFGAVHRREARASDRAREHAALSALPALPSHRLDELRGAAAASAWPRHCPDPRCGGATCRGALRRLAENLPRTQPSCLAFSLRAILRPAELGADDIERATSMLPNLFRPDRELARPRRRRRADESPLGSAQGSLLPAEDFVAITILALPGAADGGRARGRRRSTTRSRKRRAAPDSHRC